MVPGVQWGFGGRILFKAGTARREREGDQVGEAGQRSCDVFDGDEWDGFWFGLLRRVETDGRLMGTWRGGAAAG